MTTAAAIAEFILFLSLIHIATNEKADWFVRWVAKAALTLILCAISFHVAKVARATADGRVLQSKPTEGDDYARK